MTEKLDGRFRTKGDLIIIGGAEEKEGSTDILEEVAKRAKKANGCLVIVTAATELPEEVADEYRKVFRDLGVKNIAAVDVRTREDGYDEARVEICRQASVIFFTGGDQLRITSQIGDTLIYRCMRDLYRDGGTIAGTSAGAAAMSGTMLISGPGNSSDGTSDLNMAPGLDLLQHAIIDTHFAERGRIGRLLAAVSQNPRNIGLGIDENTALVVERNESFRVMGSGAAYVVDASSVTFSSLSEETRSEDVLSMHDITLHVLGSGSRFDLMQRRPVMPKNPERLRA
jgi:cyanophycinase